MNKKRVLTSVLAIMLITILLTLTGCGVQEKSKSSDKEEASVKEFTMGDTTLKFDQDATFNDLKYKRPDGLEKSESQKACYLMYKNNDIYDGTYVFRLVLMYREDTTIEKSMSEEERNNNEKMTINGIDWTVFREESSGYKVVIYATEIDNKVYALYTQIYADSNIDANQLSDIFMSGVTRQ